MPRELIVRDIEEDWDEDGGHVLEHREDDLTVSWGQSLTWVPTDGRGAPDVVQVSVKHSMWAGEAWGSGDGIRIPKPDRSRELYSAGLTRKQINHLIKTLRKARDQVFGTDE